MDAHEEQRVADHRAAALHALGWRTGAGTAIWARVISDELARHDGARERFRTNTVDREAWERLHGSGLVIVVAIAQVLAFEERVRKLTGDAELTPARAAFDLVGARAGALRDVAAHLDAYAVGEGDRQTGRGRQHEPAVTERHVEQFISWTESGDTLLALGEDRLNLHAAARAAIVLAPVVEGVRERHLRLVEARANAALRRRHGLDP
ncbi:MAG TPA: hypothetical protein VGC59_08000 [Solirubrobacteraceae bacterium]